MSIRLLTKYAMAFAVLCLGRCPLQAQAADSPPANVDAAFGEQLAEETADVLSFVDPLRAAGQSFSSSLASLLILDEDRRLERIRPYISGNFFLHHCNVEVWYSYSHDAEEKTAYLCLSSYKRDGSGHQVWIEANLAPETMKIDNIWMALVQECWECVVDYFDNSATPKNEPSFFWSTPIPFHQPMEAALVCWAEGSHPCGSFFLAPLHFQGTKYRFSLNVTVAAIEERHARN